MIIDLIILTLCLIYLFIFIKNNYKSNNDRTVEHFNNKPKLWVYWENKPNTITPPHIKLCLKTIFRHCSKSFDVIKLDNNNIYDYLPELKEKKFNLSNLLLAQKVDYYRVLLLYKYGGLYIDADVIVLKNPIEIIDKLKDYDYVGFGCTGTKCKYGCGYNVPSNWIMASRPHGKLITNVLANIESRLEKYNNDMKTWDYHDLGKHVIWEELDKLSKAENYKYYHYKSDYDGTRDKNGKWINGSILFSTKKLEYKFPSRMIFLVMYNSEMDKFKHLSENDLLYSNMNISKFYRKSLTEHRLTYKLNKFNRSYRSFVHKFFRSGRINNKFRKSIQ
jgi:hypothetical protein